MFMDIDNIPFGIDFRDHIQGALTHTDILIVVVGPKWLGPGKRGRNRIEEETDPVRIEVETALRRAIPVIPVLVDGTSMPKPEALPDGLRDFAYRNAAEVDTARDFHQHVDRLIRSMDQILGSKKTEAEPPVSTKLIDPNNPAAVATEREKTSRISYWLLIVLALGIAGGGFAVWIWASEFGNHQGSKVAESSPSTAPSGPPSRSPQSYNQIAVVSSPPAGSTSAPAANTASPIEPVSTDHNVSPTNQPQQSQSQPAATPPAAERPNDNIPIGDPGLLKETRERLYELNFDPDPPEGPITEATRDAIREYEQQNNLPPTGVASMALLRRLRETGGLRPWGSIVYGKDSKKWGMSWGEDTRKAAVAHALASCGDTKSCAVEISFFGTQCGVFAHSDSSWAITARNDIRKAKEVALSDCAKQGNSCQIVASVCAGGADRFIAGK